jgi:cobalt-zinc-cadmium efflux system protein
MHVHDHPHHGGITGGHGHFDRAMAIGIGLNTAFVVVELAAGFAADSLALVADAGHNAGDVVGLVLAWAAGLLARRPATPRFTWGFGRTTIFAALANASLLLAACGAIAWESVRRLAAPEAVAGPIVIAVAMIGAVINTLTAMLLHRGSATDLNVRGAYLHMAADAAVSVGVAVAGIAIVMTGWQWLDPAVSLVVTAAIAVGAWRLLRESLELALDAVPRGIDPATVSDALACIDGVRGVHDLHVWSPGTSEVSATVHLVVPSADDRDRVLAESTRLLRERFGIRHTTVQLEQAEGCRPGHPVSLH